MIQMFLSFSCLNIPVYGVLTTVSLNFSRLGLRFNGIGFSHYCNKFLRGLVPLVTHLHPHINIQNKNSPGTLIEVKTRVH